MDYRGLNIVTIKDKYPLPLMPQVIETLYKSAWFSKMDLKNGLNLNRIAVGDEWRMDLRTQYGAFKYLVMSLA